MKRIGTSLLLFTLLGTTCSALTLQNAIQETFNVNHEILSNKYNAEAQQKAFEEKKSAYYPSVDLSNDTQNSKRKNLNKESSDDKININGNRAVLSVEQLIYDAGKTSGMVGEAEANYWSSVFDANSKSNDTILKVVKSYLQLSSTMEIDTILNYNKKTHAKSLDIAQNNEKISGELLETKKVLSMVTTLDDKIISNENQKEEARNEFNKHTKIEKIDNLCRPIIDEKLVPKSLDEFLATVISNSPKIKEQEKNIEKQSEKIKQALSRFQPNVKLKVEGVHDKDIELVEKGTQEELVGKVVLNWNFYSGGGDSLNLEKERILLIKEKELLEKSKAEEIEKVKNIYLNYTNTKERISNLKKTLAMDIDILRITRQQLEDGTRTFYDELNAKSKVYDTQMNLIKQEYKLIENYFNLIVENGTFPEYLQNSSKENCAIYTVEDLTQERLTSTTTTSKKNSKNSKNSEMDLLEKSMGNTQSQATVEETKPVKVVEKKTISENSLEADFEDLFKDSKAGYDLKNLAASMKFTPDLFTTTAVNKSDSDIATLDNLLNKMIELASMHKDTIKGIEIELHTSSEFRTVVSEYEKITENQKLSLRRAEKVKTYLLDKISKKGTLVNLKAQDINAIGKGSNDLIYTNGVEDKEASRRIVVKLLRK